jgi:hypothetical protein
VVGGFGDRRWRAPSGARIARGSRGVWRVR